MDRSLRIIATDLGGIKNWEHLRGMLSFLFEIYGMHNAANFFQYSILMQLFVDWVHVLLTWVLKSEKFINKLCICTCIYSFYGALLIFFFNLYGIFYVFSWINFQLKWTRPLWRYQTLMPRSLTSRREQLQWIVSSMKLWAYVHCTSIYVILIEKLI